MTTEFLNIKSKEELAFYLGITQGKLNFILYKIDEDSRYKEFKLTKNNGGVRVIQSPILPLKQIQTRLKIALEAIYKPNFSVQGYVEGRSIKTNALFHRKSKFVARIDLENFFPTINFGRILGLFRAPPFNFNEKISIILAQVCTFKGHLPIGAPSSPILSNIICRGLDFEIRKLARESRCKYTRYADDLVFSTSQEFFPSDIMISNDKVVGKKLELIINSHGFSVNIKKNQLTERNRRQLVTGLVVNSQVKVKKEYIKNLRAVLHNWEKTSLEKVENDFFEKYDKKNRLKDRTYLFEQIIIGKINYVGFINGWGSNIYIELAQKLKALSPRFKLNLNRSYNEKNLQIKIFTEGKTDEYYLQSALKHFKSKSKFINLYFDFREPRSGRGDISLLENLKMDHLINSNKLVIYLFDRDNENILRKIITTDSDYKDWGNKKYSVAIPAPDHRKGKLFCIEQCFTDLDLLRTDNYGRRIYQLSEFDTNGTNIQCPNIRLKKENKTSLICENVLTEFIETGVTKFRNIAMSKNDFSLKILNQEEGFKDLDFSGFNNLFELLTAIQEKHLRN